jgi:hypothetical protein
MSNLDLADVLLSDILVYGENRKNKLVNFTDDIGKSCI